MSEGQIALARRVGEALKQARLHLVTAESCTGGGIAATITEIPGSSNWFERGFIVYSNASKVEVLGVDPELLGGQGAVSEAVVQAMTAGALAHSTAGLAVAVSGIAGPDGGSAEKPVGTVCLAWQRRGQGAVTQTVWLAGNRGEVRAATIHHALEGILRVLQPRVL